MKLVFRLAGGVAVISFQIYRAGGVAGFEPEQLFEDTKAAITPGMSWKQVEVADSKKPKKCRRMIIRVRSLIIPRTSPHL